MNILDLMDKPLTVPALANTLEYLWGYFKREATSEEKEIYLKSEPEMPLLGYLYRLAVQYNRQYLLHSTVFADPLRGGAFWKPPREKA